MNATETLVWRSVLFADAAVTAIASHQITFFCSLPLIDTVSFTRTHPHTRPQSVSISQSLIVCFFAMLLRCLKFYHFNVFAMNFHAFICLCSNPESERVIVLRRPRPHRRRRRWLFMDFLDWNKRSWNYEQNEQQPKSKNKNRKRPRMRINGEAASTLLIDPFYLCARMHKIPFFSEWWYWSGGVGRKRKSWNGKWKWTLLLNIEYYILLYGIDSHI